MPTLPEPVVSFRGVSFEREEGQPVVSGLTFDIEPGERILLAGPSGAGKSTIAMLMNGLLPENSDGEMHGEVRWFGTSSASWKQGTITKRIGMLFQDPDSQFCMTTVEEEIAFGLENLHLEAVLMPGRIDEALHAVGLAGYEKRIIQSLSGGQKQRVALACLLAMKMEMLILDEPFANVDPLARQELLHLLEQLTKDRTVTLVVIDHDLTGWLHWMDRLFCLNDNGQLVSTDTVSQTFADPELLLSQRITLPHYIGQQLENGEKTILLNEKDWIGTHVETDPAALSPMSRPVLLETDALELTLGDARILSDLSLTLYQGETVAFCGHNGAGKSSLALLLAGLYKESGGSVTLNGRNRQSLSMQEIRAMIGFVFQNPEHQFVENTVDAELAFGLTIQRQPKKMIQEKVDAMLRQIRLERHRDLHPLALSQGQKRRLSVATMTIDEPALLFLDEPTYGQDHHARTQLAGMISSRRERGLTTVMITHDMELVQQTADRVIVLSGGRNVWSGATPALWQQGQDFLTQHGLLLPASVRLKGGARRVAAYH